MIRLAVTRAALLLCRLHRFDMFAVANGSMTTRTLNLMIRHVHLMDEIPVAVLLQVFNLGVTGVAAFDRHEAVSRHFRLMAAVAVDSAFERRAMIV